MMSVFGFMFYELLDQFTVDYLLYNFHRYMKNFYYIQKKTHGDKFSIVHLCEQIL